MTCIIKNRVFHLAFVILFFGIIPLFVSAAEIPIRFAPHHREWAYRYGPVGELPRGLMYDSFNKVILVPEGSSIKSIADLTAGELKQITEYLKRRAAEIDALARKMAAQRAFEKACAQDVYVRGAADKQALIDAGIIDADGKLTKVGENFKGRILAAEEVRARDAADAGFLDKNGNVTAAGQKEGLVRQGKRYFDTSETAEQVLAGTQRAKDLEALGAGRTVFNLKTPVGVVESCVTACPAPDSAAEKIAQSLQSGREAIKGERVVAMVNRNTGAIAWFGEGAPAELLKNPENVTISLRVNANTGEITSFAPESGRLEPQAVANLQQGISVENAAQFSRSIAARIEAINEFARTGCAGVLPETMSAGEFNAAVEGRFAEVQALKGAAKEAAIAEIVGKTPAVWRVAGVTFRVIGGALNIWLAYDVGKYSAEKIDAGLKAGTIVDEMSATQNTTLRVQFDRLKALWTRYVAALKAEARPCADTKNLSDELFVSMMQTKQNILHLAGVYGGLRETLRQIIANDQGGASEALYDMLKSSGIQSVTDLFDYFGVAQTDIDYYNAPTTAKSGKDLLLRYLDTFRTSDGDAAQYIFYGNERVLIKYVEEAMRDKSKCKAEPASCPASPARPVCEEQPSGGGQGAVTCNDFGLTTVCQYFGPPPPESPWVKSSSWIVGSANLSE